MKIISEAEGETLTNYIYKENDITAIITKQGKRWKLLVTIPDKENVSMLWSTKKKAEIHMRKVFKKLGCA